MCENYIRIHYRVLHKHGSTLSFRIVKFDMESLLTPTTEMKCRRLEESPTEANVKFVGYVTKSQKNYQQNLFCTLRRE
jgi:hypothetical protein